MSEKSRFAKSMVIELVIYSVLVTVYFFLVLHFLGDWLRDLFDGNKGTYATVALVLILGQGVVLENLTRFLLGLIRSRTD